MRLWACVGCLLLALGGCAHFPERIAIELDGVSIEVKPKPALPAGDDAR